MKRARRQTLARGLTGRQRRRLTKMIARGLEHEGTLLYTGFAVLRDARRLSEAGLAAVVATKVRPWRSPPIAEIALFTTREAARGRYPADCIMPRRRR
jgi:hypothetical protein